MLIISLSLASSGFRAEPPEYFKEYYNNGILKSEGLLPEVEKSGYRKFNIQNVITANQGQFHTRKKEKYWYYSHENANLRKEGRYQSGVATNWWIYCNSRGHIIHKNQLQNDVKNGYRLKYTNQKLSSAEKTSMSAKLMNGLTLTTLKKILTYPI